MSYYENRIKALEQKVAEMAKRERMKAIPVEAQLLDSIARLKAEVERLRKAGDAMLPFFIYPPYEKGSHKAVLNWNAAKEGKPSV